MLRSRPPSTTLPGPGLPGRPPGRRRTTAGPKPPRRPGHAGRVPPAPSGWQLALGSRSRNRTRRRRPACLIVGTPARHQCAQGQRGRTPAGRPGIHRHQRRHLHHRCPAQHPAHQQGFQPHHRLRPADVSGRTRACPLRAITTTLFFRDMWEKPRPLRQLAGRDQNRRKDGSLSNEWLSISCVRNAAGAISHYVGLFSDL